MRTEERPGEGKRKNERRRGGRTREGGRSCKQGRGAMSTWAGETASIWGTLLGR